MTDPRDAFPERAKHSGGGGGGIVPVIREVITDADTPVAALAKIARPPFAFLLESLVGGERWARYTFLGTEPREVWRYRGAQVDRWTPATAWQPAGETADPVGHLAQRMRALPAVPVPGLPLAGDDRRAPLHAASRYPRAAFERDVARIREYIARGDAFQTVLARRQDVAGAVNPLLLYRYLRALNPAPYLFYLALDDIAFVGSSPEVLVRVEGDEVTVRPIAGTRPRGATPAEDEALATALRADEKELAEHRMLVDLGRNDVGRVSQYGSVRVTDALAIERYSHVQHLVSEVRGRLRPG